MRSKCISKNKRNKILFQNSALSVKANFNGKNYFYNKISIAIFYLAQAQFTIRFWSWNIDSIVKMVYEPSCKKSSKIKIHFWRNIDWQTLHREINNNYTLLQFQRVFTCFDRLQALIDTVYWIYKVSFREATTISRSRNCFAPKTEESRAYSF